MVIILTLLDLLLLIYFSPLKITASVRFPPIWWTIVGNLIHLILYSLLMISSAIQTSERRPTKYQQKMKSESEDGNG